MSKVQRIVVAGVLATVVAAPEAQAAPLSFLPAMVTAQDPVRDVRVADFNRDKVDDLVVGSVCSATILRGQGDGTWRSVDRLTVPGACEDQARGSLAVGDFDGDGLPDIVAGRNDSTNLSVFFNTPDGFDPTPEVVPVGGGATTTPAELVTGDLDRDGLDDVILLATAGGRGVHVVLANGVGFDPAVTYTSGLEGAISLAAGRVDAGDALDVLVGIGSSVQLLRGNGDGTLTPGPSSGAGGPVWGLLTAPLRGSGQADVVVTSRVVQSLVAAADGSLAANPVRNGVPIAGGGEAAVAAAGDIDGDGRTDVVTAGEGFGASIGVLYGNGGGDFATHRFMDLLDASFPVGGLSDAQLVDADRDGDLDIIAVAPKARAVMMLRNDPAIIQSTAAGLLFADTPVGKQSEPKAVTYSSEGLRPLGLPPITVSGPYVVTADTCTAMTLPIGGRCTMTVAFKPTRAGAAVGQITLPGLATTMLGGRGTRDTAAPTITASVSKQKLKTVLSRGLKVTARCSEMCTVRASLRLKNDEVAKRAVKLTGKRKTFTLKLTSKARKANAKARKLAFTVRLTATDTAGNTRTTNKKITVTR